MSKSWRSFTSLLCSIICLMESIVVASSDHPVVIIVSFDGFRYDYLEKVDTPNFDYLAGIGVKALWIQPAFPSITFPNHHTIATGLYPESHGIVANNFYDPSLNDTFTMDKTDPVWWDTGAMPLYILNEKAGDGRHSGVMMWVGSSSSYFNESATYIRTYNSSVEWTDRVDGVINWLTDEHNPANCIFLYFEEPDHDGHEFGPDSPEVQFQIERADNITGYLISKLKSVNLFDSAELIITSDHGMDYIPKENEFVLTDVVNQTYYRDFASSPVIHILPEDGLDEVVYEGFSNVSDKYHFDAYRKEDIPEEYHYQNNARIMPIILVARENYTIDTHEIPWHLLGNHGYNNSLPSMRAFFIAHGPSFKEGFVSTPFRNLDIYPLASHLLGLTPAPNNGSFEEVNDLLKVNNRHDSSNAILIVTVVIVGIMLVIAVFLFAKYSSRRYENHRREDRRPLSSDRTSSN